MTTSRRLFLWILFSAAALSWSGCARLADPEASATPYAPPRAATTGAAQAGSTH